MTDPAVRPLINRLKAAYDLLPFNILSSSTPKPAHKEIEGMQTKPKMVIIKETDNQPSPAGGWVRKQPDWIKAVFPKVF
nr:hypothetical protein [uncultured Desulfobacter sp.]